MIAKKYKIEDAEMPTELNDEGQWCGYRLDADGDTVDEMFANAVVTAVDQDGGDIWSLLLSECENEFQDDAEKMIKNVVGAA
jgi:hypothetical protein